jgi:hypothetical protein
VVAHVKELLLCTLTGPLHAEYAASVHCNKTAHAVQASVLMPECTISDQDDCAHTVRIDHSSKLQQ